jgi:hypothetical protein
MNRRTFFALALPALAASAFRRKREILQRDQSLPGTLGTEDYREWLTHHSHLVSDPGHQHSWQLGAHQHNINDPGHSHSLATPGYTHSYELVDCQCPSCRSLWNLEPAGQYLNPNIAAGTIRS